MNSEPHETKDLAQRFPARKTDPQTLERLAAGARAAWAADEGRPVQRTLPWIGALSAAAAMAAMLLYGLVLTRVNVGVEPSAREVPEGEASGDVLRLPAGETEKPRQVREKDPNPAPLAPEPSPAPAQPEKEKRASDSPFKNRETAISEQAVTALGGSKETVKAVEAGLRWLVAHQEADGHWDSTKHGGKAADVSITGLSLLALLARGHSEKQGQFKDSVVRAVTWLKSVQADNGCLYKAGETHGVGYHHGIAGLALIEAAAMARVPETVDAAQRVVNYSVNEHQNPETGGWRYAPKSAVSDLCVSAWYIQQLKRAKQAGLKVEAGAIEGAMKFLDSVQVSKGSDRHEYGYTDRNNISYRRTAMGIHSRQLLGWSRKEFQASVDWFIAQGGVPDWGVQGEKADLFFWYYGTQVVFQQGGQAWLNWNAALKACLVDNQRAGGDEHGSWDPLGSHAGYFGRVGQTALATLCLEVYFRYDPLYAELAPSRAPTDDERTRADALISKFSAEEFQEREDALKELVKLGMPIRAHLEGRLKQLKEEAQPDAEVQNRLVKAIDAVTP